MTTSEITALLEKRAEKLAELCREAYFNAEGFMGQESVQGPDESFKAGHASTHSLIQMLVQALEYYCHFKNREGDYTFRSDEGRKAFNTLEKLRAELGDAE